MIVALGLYADLGYLFDDVRKVKRIKTGHNIRQQLQRIASFSWLWLASRIVVVHFVHECSVCSLFTCGRIQDKSPRIKDGSGSLRSHCCAKQPENCRFPEKISLLKIELQWVFSGLGLGRAHHLSQSGFNDLTILSGKGQK